MQTRLLACAALATLMVVPSGAASAQTTTNSISAPNNAQSTANPQVDLNQQGSLVNTQVNTYPLGRSIVGNGVADCTSEGIALSAYGSGIGPFDSGSIGGSFTYTHSFGMKTCNEYAQTQLSKSRLENCLLLISNYSKMKKAGVDVSYQALKQIAGVDCPPVAIQGLGASAPFNNGFNPGPNYQNQAPQNQAPQNQSQANQNQPGVSNDDYGQPMMHHQQRPVPQSPAPVRQTSPTSQQRLNAYK